MSHSSSHIAHIRKDYSLAALDESTVGSDPVAFFSHWFGEALEAQISEVNAMTLATADKTGTPHARIVLLKGVENGGFTFFTNYNSHKGHHIEAQQHVALLFFWKELERQVRIEGIAHKLAAGDSDAYFNSRPMGSRIGAWASPQTQVISSRDLLDKNVTDFQKKFEGTEPTRPPHWGGYNIQPTSIEFWQGRSSRLHDRILFEKDENGIWEKCRLAP